ncbi:MAG: hypothetical protein WKF84_03440 [Pyrinomonadaceae bacterium]
MLLEEAKGENRLRRVLGPVQLTSLGVGAIIGTGIFVLTGRRRARQDRPGPHAFVRRRRASPASSRRSATQSLPRWCRCAGAARTPTPMRRSANCSLGSLDGI